MLDTLTELDQATPDWLTAILRRNGALDRGRVVAVDQDRVWSSSWVVHLTLTYAQPDREAPDYLLLKVANPDTEQMMPRRNLREVQFYTAIAPLAEDLPVVRCYDASYHRAEVDHFHLLLDDPSRTTHRAAPYSAVPPMLEQSEMIVDALASVHGRCWDNRQIDAGFGDRPATEWQTGLATEEYVRWAEETTSRFLADLGERISPARTALYRRIAAHLPSRLLDRHAQSKNLTLTQGDVHVGNFLYPRDPTVDRLYIIDWKRASIALGANDLAYMMALFWFPDVRARWEKPLLERYHQRLVEHGVVGYAWADLWDDYRLSVLNQLFEAIWGWSVGQNTLMWWNHLERITHAIEDLHCLDAL